ENCRKMFSLIISGSAITIFLFCRQRNHKISGEKDCHKSTDDVRRTSITVANKPGNAHRMLVEHP
ncbi:MAG: hypothetical protein KKD31_12245, partial [Bacteroidetes bacterium]|nr:hypothetical protein [Bacteroidota bacterium]